MWKKTLQHEVRWYMGAVLRWVACWDKITHTCLGRMPVQPGLVVDRAIATGELVRLDQS